LFYNSNAKTKNSFRLNLAERAIHLLNNLTSELIEFETRLCSQTNLLDDENHIHRQLTDIDYLFNRIPILEKSISELLELSRQFDNQRLVHTSEQLANRWQFIRKEISLRQRTLGQICDSYRVFRNLFEQEQTIFNRFERRVRSLEPLSIDIERLRRNTKVVTVKIFRKRKKHLIILVFFFCKRIFLSNFSIDLNRSNI